MSQESKPPPLGGVGAVNAPLIEQYSSELTPQDERRHSRSRSTADRAAGFTSGEPVDLAAQVKETAQTTAKAISAQASELLGNVGDELSQTADQQKARGADVMRDVARAIHNAAGELSDRSPEVATTIHTAADSIQGLADTLQSRKIGELVTAASDAARTHPTTFFIGAIAAGFAISRFLKSSSPGKAAVTAPAYAPGEFGDRT